MENFQVFLLLLHINKRKYAYNVEMVKDYILSERFQIAENVRSTRLLYPLMIGFLFVSILAIFLFMFLFRIIARFLYNLNNVDILLSLCGQSFDILLASYTIIFPWLAMNSHQKLFEAATLILRCIHKKLRARSGNIRPTTNKPQIHDLNGRSLVPLNTNEETDVYFKNLYNLWNK